MSSDRIISTLKFFDLQGVPLTLFELHKFLLADGPTLRKALNDRFELPNDIELETLPATIGELSGALERLMESGQVSSTQGYYCLPGRESIIRDRLQNYAYGIQRERRIKKFVKFLRYLPFVRGAAVGGSQALGQQTAASDIDMFIVTDPKFLWLARTLVTAYFQLFGVRRHGDKIANRFCLNHYVAGPREVADERDPYNALEYLRLRGVVYPHAITEFKRRNMEWIRKFYPNVALPHTLIEPQLFFQKCGEYLFRNQFGSWFNAKLSQRQMPSIQKGEYAVATEQELSFHSKERKYIILRQFFPS